MDRAVARGLWLLIAWVVIGVGALPSAHAAEPLVVVLTGPDAEADDAAERVLRRLALAPEDATLLDPASLRERVRVVSLDRRAEDAGCGGPIWVEQWLDRVDQAEVAVQLLDFNGALGLVSELELEVGCLDRLPQRTDLLRLHLVAASAALLASQEASKDMARFYTDRLMLAARAARGLGDDLLLPVGLDPRIQRLVETVEIPAAVPVAAAGDGGRVFVDGEPVGRGVSRLVPGLRLVQVLGGDGATAVGAASLYPLERATLLYAGRLERDQLEQDVAAIGQGLPASALVRSLQRLLGAELLVASLSPRGVVVRGLDGGEVGRSGGGGSAQAQAQVQAQAQARPPAAEREVVLAWHERLGFGGDDRPVVVGVGVASGWSRLRDPVAGDLSGAAGGVAVWLRVPTPIWLTLAASAETLGRREPLPDGYDADWLYRAWIPVRVGARVEGTFDSLRWELGLDGVAALLGAYDGAQRLLPGLAVAGALTRPIIDRRFALRVAAQGTAGLNLVGGGVIVGVDSVW